MLMITEPAGDFFSPQQIGLYIGQAVTLILAIFAFIQVVAAKKIRTPADNQAREDFAYRVLKERLDEANADRAVLTDTVNYLREDARKRDVQDNEDFEREQQRVDLVRSLNTRISDLSRQVQELEQRQDAIADKVRRNFPITLADIYGTGVSNIAEGLGDVEMTQVPPVRTN